MAGAVGFTGGFAGCAGSGEPDDGTTDTTTTGEQTTDGGMAGTTDGGPDGTTAAGGSMDGPTVTTVSTDEYDDVLADSDGRVLYLFTRDEGGESACYDSCATNWPPLAVEGEATAGEGVTADLGTTQREDGSMQVTAAGHPLYYFAGDDEPGDTNGQGLNDVWFVLAPDGSAVEGMDETTGQSPY